MQKDEYLKKLASALSGIPDAQKKDILADYAEHFEMGVLDGRSEEEISEALGDPRTIGREYTAAALVKNAEADPSAGGLGRAILATIGLGLFNLIVVLIPLICIIMVLAVLFLIGFSLCCAGPILTGGAVLELLGIVSGVLFFSAPAAVFLGIGITCLGLLILIMEYWLIRVLYRIGIRYLKWNIAVIHGSEQI
ncbi:DUF1700 domain-containing protein [Methanospirillum sp.]|uniref:DUF1700 domain-containing protein n=1 Tax=Methanospirillum sp. TaxID=45200 RepID=UPI002B6F1C5A|nr:DUF1700 domain-containing protein [Methanospirillum sp.]HPP76981.1 DUF1700 domain-containing protein [Methanospirillum sp.]